MKTKIYLKPLKKHLTGEISPKQLARLLDELAFDYSRIVIRLQEIEDEIQKYTHPETGDFLYNLKALRDVLRKCRA